MQKLAAACLFALTLTAPAVPSGAGSATEPACAAARDDRLATLDAESNAIAVAFDTDAAVMESPEYQLLKDKDALLHEIAEEAKAAWERYRRCAAGAAPR
jgi:hypothetical protein